MRELNDTGVDSELPIVAAVELFNRAAEERELCRKRFEQAEQVYAKISSQYRQLLKEQMARIDGPCEKVSGLGR